MSANGAQGHAEGSNRLFLSVWAVLLLLTGVEVYLGYIHLSVGLMLVLLMGLSLVKAGLIIAYFMHLRFERFSLVLTLIPMWVIVTLLLLMFFPDSFRLLELRFPK
jgi:cytochrome c oxidase subunit 4